MSETTDLIFAGVGGQGVLLIAKLTAQAAVRAEYEVKQTEVHGVSQRGGSVESHVRFGQAVHSPLVLPGQADVVIGLEKLEALRYANYLDRHRGVLLVNDYEIVPASVAGGAEKYPHHALDFLTAKGVHVVVLPASQWARDIGDGRMANMVLLGALSARLPSLAAEVWMETLQEEIPAKHRETNLRAFQIGKEASAV